MLAREDEERLGNTYLVEKMRRGQTGYLKEPGKVGFEKVPGRKV